MNFQISTKQPPLIIDLDGTLIKTDLLIESALVHARSKPLEILKPIFWLLSGKAFLKQKLAHSAKIDVSTLPYNQEVIGFIEQEREKGRIVILATASHKTYADQISNHLGIFERVLATDGTTNLSAKNKRDALVAEFGEGGFDYVGNSNDDFPVWQSARVAYAVAPEFGVIGKAKKLDISLQVIPISKPSLVKSWVKALRFHQWVKNLLIFVPLLASHQIGNIHLILIGLLAFLFFGLCASSVYILNDLLDLGDDRHHPSKRNRAFASGRVSVKSGIMAFPVLLLAGLAGSALLLPWQFTAVLISYYFLTLAYSIALKRMMVIDVIMLGMLYTLRIIAGSTAIGSVPTFWMLAFSIFMFLSLAFVKRYAELREAKNSGKSEKTRGRGYYPDDLEIISSMGVASGYLSTLVLALYIQDYNTTQLYRHPQIIWLSCPLLLFWISRTWMLTHRGHMHEDPIVFALRDTASRWTGIIFLLIFALAA